MANIEFVSHSLNRYIIVEGDNIQMFIKEIQKWIGLKYIPQGGIATSYRFNENGKRENIIFYQAMFLPI